MKRSQVMDQVSEMPPENFEEKLRKLIDKGTAVIATHRTVNGIGFPTLDRGAAAGWAAQAVATLTRIFGKDHLFVTDFPPEAKEGYFGSVKAGMGILRAAIEELPAPSAFNFPQNDSSTAEKYLHRICDRFHLISRQLQRRQRNRDPFQIKDEYDVQDLMHALLQLYFDDIRPEEYTPSYSGKSSRMDFLLKNEQIVVETKMTRVGLTERELGSQLVEDKERYRKYQGCKKLICFAYDPNRRISNPRGCESDLSEDGGEFCVRLLVRPV